MLVSVVRYQSQSRSRHIVNWRLLFLQEMSPQNPAAFRKALSPGEDLFVLFQEFKHQRRLFISDVQGIVNGEIAFDARLSGMMTEPRGF